MNIKTTLALCLALLLCSSVYAQDTAAPQPDPGTYEGAPEDLHIYLLIGQSNMAGRAPITEDQQGPIANAYLLNAQDTWQPATNPMNLYSTIRKGEGMQRLNPGYGFTLAMLEHNPDASIGLVVNARGGTRIEQWERGTQYYNEALRRLRAAQQTGTVMGVLWHQGESNEGNPEGYLEKLQALANNLREDMQMPALPFIAGQVNNVPAINDQIAQLPATLAHTGFVSSEGLTCSDRWHFDTPSMLLLGQRYAEQMIAVQAAAVVEE